MSKKLIINADDFGLSRGQNYGIIESFEHGVVRSTTAMMNSPAIEHAAWLSRKFPELAVGIHFVLTWGTPFTPLASLVDQSGKLSKNVWQKNQDGTLNLDEVKQELTAQYEHFIKVFGRAPTHIDSHHHVHMLSTIYPVVEAFARECNIPLRIDRNELAKQGVAINYDVSCDMFDDTFYCEVGQELNQMDLLRIVDKATAQGAQSLEIMCHPAFIDQTIQASAYNQARLTELDILTDPALPALLDAKGYQLANYLDWKK